MKHTSEAPDVVPILHDIAMGRRNSAGDPWSLTYCIEAANELEFLRDALAKRADPSAVRELVEALENIEDLTNPNRWEATDPDTTANVWEIAHSALNRAPGGGDDDAS